MFALLLASPDPRHDEKVSASRIVVAGNDLVWEVDVARSWLEDRVKFPAPPADLTDAQLQSVKEPIAAYLREGLSVELNGKAVQPEVGDLLKEEMPFIATGELFIGRMKLTFRCRAPGEIRTLRLGVRFFADQARRHQALVEIAWNGALYTFAPLGPAEIVLPPPSRAALFLATAWGFLRLGLTHMVTGVDHVAFLLALLLGARRASETLMAVMSYTVAHTLTLLFGAMDVLQVKPQVAESLVAASVVYVAIENFRLPEAKYRWILAFAFGLVHGAGFAQSLKERLTEASGTVLPVLSFNAGIGLGQLAVMLVGVPLLAWARGSADPARAERRGRRLLVGGSVVLLLVGLTCLVDRLFGVGVFPRWAA
jgi:hydrogenase/urease accessory protein HupE